MNMEYRISNVAVGRLTAVRIFGANSSVQKLKLNTEVKKCLSSKISEKEPLSTLTVKKTRTFLIFFQKYFSSKFGIQIIIFRNKK